MPQPTSGPGQHDRRLDAVRGLGAIAVVVGHAILSVYRLDLTQAPGVIATMFTFFSAVGLPIFMFVAGRLARPERGWRWLVARVWRLLVPYAAWTVVQYFLWYRPQGPMFFVRAAIDPSNTNALWFLYALFVMSALLVLVRGDDRAVALLALATIVLPWPDDRRLAFSYVAAWMPAFAAGYLTRKRGLDPGPAWVGAFALSFLLLWAGPGSNLLGGSAPHWIVGSVTSGLPGADVLARVALRTARALLAVSAVLASLRAARWLGGRYLVWLGTASLGIYCAHLPFVSYNPPQGAMWVLVSAGASLAGASAVVWALQRSAWTSFLFLGSGVPRGASHTGGNRRPQMDAGPTAAPARRRPRS